MKAAKYLISALLLVASTGACGLFHSHDEEALSHGVEEEATISVSLWTDDLELFMEHPTLRVGEPAKFAVHLTKMNDFQALGSGPVLFHFSKGGIEQQVVTVESPTIPGIFGPLVTFDEAGEYTLRIEVRSQALAAEVEHGPLLVLSSDAPAPEAGDEPGGQIISYLKEQQWKLPFATVPAERRNIHETLRVPARILPKGGSESLVTAAVAGRYEPPEAGSPILGSMVRKGDLLGYIELLPPSRSDMLSSRISTGMALGQLSEDLARSEAAVASEQARLNLALKDLERVRSLVEVEALPIKRLSEAETEVEIRQAAVRAAEKSLGVFQQAAARYEGAEGESDSVPDRLALKAPITGQIVELGAVAGQQADARDPLFRIVDARRVWVEGQVYERDIVKLEGLKGGTLTLPGMDPISFESSEMVFSGARITSESRTLPVVFELANSGNRIKLGSIGTLSLITNQKVEALVVPKDAVLLEENRTVVYLQVEGESFERRLVKTGIESPEGIEIVDGIDEGDRVVSVGAYDVALAGRSTEVPDHGHVH